MPMNERRPHKRYPVGLLDITISMIQASYAEIINISFTGISLRANRRLNIGETYTLKIKSKGTVLNLKGTVTWSRISGSQKGLSGDCIPIYTAGVQFLDASQNEGEQILNFIEIHKKEYQIVGARRLNDIRLYTRTRVSAPEKAFILDQRESYKLNQLSFSGARIKSKHPMKVNSTVPMMISFTEDKFIVFQGRISSCLLIRDAHTKAYNIGIEITQLSRNDREILAEFIRLLDAIEKSPREEM